jgi:hypothetical protein
MSNPGDLFDRDHERDAPAGVVQLRGRDHLSEDRVGPIGRDERQHDLFFRLGLLQ